MSLLSIISNVHARVGLTAPTAVIGNTDYTVVQMLALLNQEVEELASGVSAGLSYDWTVLQTEATFTTVATNVQGAINTIAPGFKFFIKETIWNRSTRLAIQGGLSPQEWQAYKAWGITGPYPRFRIQGGNLEFLPVPKVGDSCYFEYQSKYAVRTANGVTQKATFTLDTDVSVMDEGLLTAGLTWRWHAMKGLDYAEEFRTYQNRVTEAIARDGAKETLHMGGTTFWSGVIIPVGNWNQ